MAGDKVVLITEGSGELVWIEPTFYKGREKIDMLKIGWSEATGDRAEIGKAKRNAKVEYKKKTPTNIVGVRGGTILTWKIPEGVKKMKTVALWTRGKEVKVSVRVLRKGAKLGKVTLWQPLHEGPILNSRKLSEDNISVDVKSLSMIRLKVGDGGNGIGSDGFNWIEPIFILKNGKKIKVATELKWVTANSGYGRVRVGAKHSGGAITYKGREIKNAIGTHAISHVSYVVPAGAVKFEVIGYRNGGTVQAIVEGRPRQG